MGMTITYDPIQVVEQIADKTDKVTIITKARETKLTMDCEVSFIVCTYEKDGEECQEDGRITFVQRQLRCRLQRG